MDGAFDPPIPSDYDGRDGSLEISSEEEEALIAAQDALIGAVTDTMDDVNEDVDYAVQP